MDEFLCLRIVMVGVGVGSIAAGCWMINEASKSLIEWISVGAVMVAVGLLSILGAFLAEAR